MKVHVVIFDQEITLEDSFVEDIQDDDSLFDDAIFYHAQDDAKYYIGVREENLDLLKQRFEGRTVHTFNEDEVSWDCGPCYG